MRTRFVPIAALLFGALACDDERTSTLLAPPQPHTGTAAYLTVSDPAAAPGAVVTVTAAVRGAAGVAKVGAFTARLAYDAAGLEYVGEQPLDGGMRALNRLAGDAGASIAAAGASADGFGDGRLFAVRFKVLSPSALRSLSLHVSELTGTDFGGQLQTLDVRRGLHADAR